MLNYIPARYEEQLNDYKYKGSDASLFYKHILSPLAQHVVDNYFPETLAPNTITLIGFQFMLIPHLIILFMFPAVLGGWIPAWLLIITAIGHFLYMIFDNADGKQARKTGNSSPLGLLFDHGCDAMNTFVSGLCVFAALQLGNTMWALVGYLIAFGVFFMATWEEYFVGSLDLPWFNGANEGLVGIILLYIFTAIVGCDFWLKTIGGIQFNHIVVFGFSFIAIPTIISNIRNVQKTGVSLGKPLKYLTTFLYLVLTMFITYYLSHGFAIEKTGRYFIYFIGFNFAKLVGILQACHCANTDFYQFQPSIWLSTTLLNVNTIIGYATNEPLINEVDLIYYLAGFALAAHLYFVVCIISQFTRVLKIRVFRVKDKHKPIEASLVSEPNTSSTNDTGTQSLLRNEMA